MQSVGTADERRAFEETLRSTHTRRITVSVTDLEGRILSALTPVLLDGQVVVDADAEVTRTATLSFLDPSHALNFDTDSPDDGALYADRMVKIDYAVFVESLDRYVSVTVFLGPVTKLDRAGDVVNVEAQGKEALSRGAIWRTLSLKKGLPVVDAIKLLLRDRAGETKFYFVSSTSKIPATKSLDRYAEIWATAKRYAASINRQLFYNGEGVAVLRALPSKAVYVFRTGNDGDVLSDVQVSYQLADIKNKIVVRGSTPKGSKTRITAQATAPSSHALSPARLGRNGVPMVLVEVIEDSAIRSTKDAQKRADSVLADRLREPVEVTFDSLPIVHLDPKDLVSIQTDDFTASFRLRQFTIPLGTEGSPVMPVGYLKRTVINRKRFRK